MLTSIEYKSHLSRLSMVAQLVADVPIADLLNHVSVCETLGPLLEPTAYIRGGSDNVRDARDLLEAASPLVSFGAKLVQRAKEREGKC